MSTGRTVSAKVGITPTYIPIVLSISSSSTARTKPATLLGQAVSRLLSGLDTMLREEKYCDFVIDCGDTKFPAHKVILCSRSEYFDRACSGNFVVWISVLSPFVSPYSSVLINDNRKAQNPQSNYMTKIPKM